MNPVVSIRNGKLRGGYNQDKDYYYFLGIPYAKPPLNELRFKAPLPPDNWIEIRDAQKEGNRSISRSTSGRIQGSEDCLYLNVYTKQLPEDYLPNRPVMFWIHGGGFLSGSGARDLFGADFLLEEDIVLVTVNYRLGLLGFLSLDDPSLGVPGNTGLKDMVMALKWVQSNISIFNGDPNNVTIFGESAGGAAAHLMLVSPMTKGLFHKAIAQSGTAVSPWSYCVKRGRKFARALGADLETDDEILNFLRRQPPEKLLEAVETVANLNDKLSFRVIGPVIENFKEGEDCFLPEDPEILLKTGRFHQVPLIIGFNSADGMIYASETFRDRSLPVDFKDVEDLVPWHLRLERKSDLSKIIGQKIKNYYYKDATPSKRQLDPYIKLQTDLKFTTVTKFAVNVQRKQSNVPIFLYKFSFDSPLNLYKKFYDLTLPGAAHGDELTYLFNTTFSVKFIPNSKEDLVRKCMVKLWTNFAKTGNPSGKNLPTTWEPIMGANDSLKYLEIKDELCMIYHEPGLESLDFWNKVYDEVNFVV